MRWTGAVLILHRFLSVKYSTTKYQTCVKNYTVKRALKPNLLPSPPLDNIQVMVIVWRLRGNCSMLGCVTQCSQSASHSCPSSSYRSSRLCLSHWDPYAMHRGSCLELYYCNMVEWSWWDSSLIWKTNWFPSVLWHCWFGHMTCKNRPRHDLWCVWWDVKPCSINLASWMCRH